MADYDLKGCKFEAIQSCGPVKLGSATNYTTGNVLYYIELGSEDYSPVYEDLLQAKAVFIAQAQLYVQQIEVEYEAVKAMVASSE